MSPIQVKRLAQRKAKESRLSFERACALLYYDHELGWFMWKVHRSQNIRAGRVAGCVCSTHGNTNSYVTIRIDETGYCAHRIAWLLMTGAWPEGEIDHENGKRSDNRFKNLRPCPNHFEQQQNAKIRVTNTSGHPNVLPWKYGWYVKIQAYGKCYIKKIKDFDRACAHAREMKAKLHKFNPVQREFAES